MNMKYPSFNKKWLQVPLKVLAVLWFIPIYAGTLVALAKLIVEGVHHYLWWYFITDTFPNTVLYIATLYYMAALTYAAFTKRTWITNGYIRGSLRYVFLRPGNRMVVFPAYLLTVFPAALYLFFPFHALVAPLKQWLPDYSAFTTKLGLIPEAAPLLQNYTIIALALILSYFPALFITRYFIKKMHFIRLHCMGILEQKK